MKTIKVAYVLSYRAPNYIRTKSILGALKTLKGFHLLKVINKKKGFARYVETLWSLLICRIKHNPDCYILGFRGHEIFLPVKIITLGKPLIFDELMSPTDALRSDYKFGKLGAFIGIILFNLEKAILKFSDRTLTDTKTHKDFLVDKFNLESEKVIPIPVGADEDIKCPRRSFEGGYDTPLRVLFYGSLLPLHGMACMVEAAKILEDQAIKFTFIGGSQKAIQEFNYLCKKFDIKNIEHIAWVDFDELMEQHLAKSDLCLGGPFGKTAQAARVVTGKTQQSLAFGIPTLVGEIDEDFGFKDKENCLLVERGCPQSLADAMIWALQNRERLGAIGESGKRLYFEKFSRMRLADILKVEIINLLRH